MSRPLATKDSIGKSKPAFRDRDEKSVFASYPVAVRRRRLELRAPRWWKASANVTRPCSGS